MLFIALCCRHCYVIISLFVIIKFYDLYSLRMMLEVLLSADQSDGLESR